MAYMESSKNIKSKRISMTKKMIGDAWLSQCFCCGDETETILQYGKNICKDCFENPKTMINFAHFVVITNGKVGDD